MLYSFEAHSMRDLAIGIMRTHLAHGGAFPSACMRWLVIAIEQASEDIRARDPKHAELLDSAAHILGMHMRIQRERDDAHYADTVPHVTALAASVTGESG